jgi:hypothetical protein
MTRGGIGTGALNGVVSVVHRQSTVVMPNRADPIRFSRSFSIRAAPRWVRSDYAIIAAPAKRGDPCP